MDVIVSAVTAEVFIWENSGYVVVILNVQGEGARCMGACFGGTVQGGDAGDYPFYSLLVELFISGHLPLSAVGWGLPSPCSILTLVLPLRQRGSAS